MGDSFCLPPLTPRRLCIALAIASAASGNFAADALPKLHALVSALPVTSTTNNNNRKPYTYKDLHSYLCNVKTCSDDEETSYSNAAEFLANVVKKITSLSDFQDVVEDFIPTLATMGSLVDGSKFIDPDGPLGIFVREVYVRFQLLSFHGTTRLYEGFLKYTRSNERGNDVNRGGEIAEEPLSNHERVLDAIRTKTAKVSSAFVDGYAASSGGDYGTLLDADRMLKTQSCATNLAVNELLSIGLPKGANVAIHGTDFIRYCEALRSRNFAQAIDSLHRYCDLALTDISAAARIESSVDETGSSDITRVYASARANALLGVSRAGKLPVCDVENQYSSLALATTFRHFGYKSLAASALKESLHIAQQHGDDRCQALALSLASQVTLHGRGCESKELRSDLASSEGTVQSANSRGEEEGDVENVDVWSKCTAQMTDISRARLRKAHSLSSSTSNPLNVRSLLQYSAAWATSGTFPTALTLARDARELSLRQRKKNAEFAELFGADENLVLSEDEAYSLAAVTDLEARLRDRKVAIQKIKRVIKRCRQVLCRESVLPIRPEIQILQRCFNQMSFEEALCNDRLRVAERFCERLHDYALYVSETNGPDHVQALLEAYEARTRWLLSCDEYEKAISSAHDLRKQASLYYHESYVAESYQLEARILLLSGNAISALFPILTALVVSHGLGQDRVYMRTVLTWVDVILNLSNEHRYAYSVLARDAIDEVLPNILGGLGLQEQGDALLLKAKATAACCQTCEDKKDSLNGIVATFNKALSIFEQIGYNRGLESCYKAMASLYNEVAMERERDIVAEKCITIIKKIAIARRVCNADSGVLQ